MTMWRVIVVHLAAFPALATVLLYGLLAPWYRTDTGRHIMAVSVVLAMVLGHQLVTYWFGMDYPGRQIVISALHLVGAVALWWRLIALVRIQILERWKKNEHHR